MFDFAFNSFALTEVLAVPPGVRWPFGNRDGLKVIPIVPGTLGNLKESLKIIPTANELAGPFPVFGLSSPGW